MSKEKLFLVQINGRDHPGLTKEISGLLGEYNADILDIGQSVIHDTLALGLLISLDGDVNVPELMLKLETHFEPLPIALSLQEISLTEYESWVKEQGKHRYIVTLLSKKLSANNLKAVSEVITRNELNIETIKRLSGRVSLSGIESNGFSSASAGECIELSLRGKPENISELRKAFLEVASELEVDIAFQMDTAYRKNRRLVVFDMDSTLIEAEVIDELAKVAGVGDKVAKITESAMRGEIDFKESFALRLSFLKGLPESKLLDIAENLKLTEGARQLIETLNVLGYKTAIVSGGFNYFGEFIKNKLNMDYVFANNLEIEEGMVTGRVSGVVVDAERKAELLKEIAQKEKINLQQVIAVGDGANDLKMLASAGLGIAFRAKPLVKQSAKQAISTFGLDGILYLMGVADKEREELLIDV